MDISSNSADTTDSFQEGYGTMDPEGKVDHYKKEENRLRIPFRHSITFYCVIKFFILLTANILLRNLLKIYFIRCYTVKRVRALKAIKGKRNGENVREDRVERSVKFSERSGKRYDRSLIKTAPN